MSADAITLPADTVWPTPTLGVAIVQGSRCGCGRPGLGYFADRQDGGQIVECMCGGYGSLAPQEWAQYEKKPCERCSGNGGWLYRNPSKFTKCGAPDCRDGHQVWTVRWPCKVCKLRHDLFGKTIDDNFGNQHYACKGTGRLSARATIQVVPVVAHDDPRCDDGSSTVVAIWPTGSAYEGAVLFLADRRIEGTRLPLDPPPTPGHDFFGVIVRLESA